MYSLESFKRMKGAIEYEAKLDEKNQHLGVRKMKSEFDPEKEQEVDDPLDIYAKNSWWHRPEWYRTGVSLMSQEKRKELGQFFKDIVGGTGRKNIHNHPIRESFRQYFRVLWEGTYSTSSERLTQVLDQVREVAQEPGRTFPEGFPQMQSMILDQERRIRIAFREDYRDFWRHYPPLKPWQAPAGLAEPDPAVNLSHHMPFFHDSLFGNSALEDDLEAVERIAKHSWNPLYKVFLYAVQPRIGYDRHALLRDTIAKRENERRTSSYDAMIPRPVADILYDHVPGWNHATHTFEYGRRLTLVRGIEEDAELQARYPEPLEEIGRSQTIPRGMQTLYQFRAFPDPHYSKFSDISTIDMAKMLTSIKLTQDFEEARMMIPEDIRPPPRNVIHEKNLHWLYIAEPEIAHTVKHGFRPSPKEDAHYEALEQSYIDKEEYIGSEEHMKNREQRTPTTEAEHMEAMQYQLEKTTPFELMKAYNPVLASGKELYHFLRFGSVNGPQTSKFSRVFGFLRAYLSTPKNQKVTLSRLLSEYWATYRLHLRTRREDVKRGLGVTDEKLFYMHEYLAEKDLQRAASRKSAGEPPITSHTSNSSSAQTPPTPEEIEMLHRSQEGTLAQGPPPSSPRPPFASKTSTVSKQHLDILNEPSETGAFFDPEPAVPPASSTSTKETSSRKKHTRSYSTSASERRSASSVPRGRLAKPWVIARYYHISRSNLIGAEKTQAANQKARDQQIAQETFLGAFQRRGDVERGKVVADVTPRRSGSKASDLNRDSVQEKLAEMMQHAQAAMSEADLYALPKRQFGRTGARRPPLSSREAISAAQRRNGLSDLPAPFPATQISMNDLSPLSILPSATKVNSGFRGAIWGISKAFGRVVSNLVRSALESSNRKLRMPSTLEEDMSKIVEWRTSQTRTGMWEKFRSQFLTAGHSVRLKLPELADTFELLYQTVHPTHEISGTTHIGSVELAKEAASRKDFVLNYVRSKLIPSVSPPLPGPGYPERLENYYRSLRSDTPESLKTEELMRVVDEKSGSRNWQEAYRRRTALFGTSADPETTKARIFADISEDLSAKESEKKNAVMHARKPLEGVADMVVRGEDGKAKGFDGNALWDDPRVRFHSPEAWKLLTTEFQQLEAEISAHCESEIDRRALNLSDFEAMLFHLQPFIDRMVAHPQDVKSRIFYIMKLNTYATSDQLKNPVWKASDSSEAAWLAKFNDVEEDKLKTDPSELYTERRTTIVDAPTNSLTEILVQLGVKPNQLPSAGDGLLSDNYQSHIDYPFLYVKDDGSFVDLNPEGEMDTLMERARALASPSDYVHQQHSRSPYSSLKELLNDDPMFLTKAWIRTLAHLRYQEQLRESWKPMSDDEDLPRLIEDLEKRLAEAKAMQTSEDEGDTSTQKEYETMRELVTDLTSDFKVNSKTNWDGSVGSHIAQEESNFNTPFQPSPSTSRHATQDSSATSTFKTIPRLEKSGMSPREYFTFGSMVASLSTPDAHSKTFVPPPMVDHYLQAASAPRSQVNFTEVIAKMQAEREELEIKVEKFVAGTRPKYEYSSYNPHLYMPYEQIPRSRALSTHWRGTEPLILHAPLMPLPIAVGLMQYMTSLKRNLSSDDYRARLQAWLAVRPELLPYIAKLTEYNEKFVKAVIDGEPLPYGEDLEKTFFHWTVSDHIRHFTTGYIEDIRRDRLMALSDLHVLLFGNPSEKQLLRQQRRNLQRKALVELEQKIAGTPVADSLATCPTLTANGQGGEERLEYSLSERIKNTLLVIGKEMEGDVLMVPIEPQLTATQKAAQDFYMDDAGTIGALEREYEHLSHEEAAIERYKDRHGLNPPKPVRPTHVQSSVVLPSEHENIEILKARFTQHAPNIVAALPSVLPSSSSQVPLPKDMLPLAGLDPNDWKRPVTAEEMTLQRLHLLQYDPTKPSTFGNYPYDWAGDAGTMELGAAGAVKKANMKVASILTEKPRFTMHDLLGTPLAGTDDFLSEQDEGVKLARLMGDPDLIREAKFLFSVKDAPYEDHADERTIRLHEFAKLKMNEQLTEVHKHHHLREPGGIPRRVRVPIGLTQARDSMRMQDEADAQAWIRRRYNSWLGQDPVSRTFDIASALSANNISKRQKTTMGQMQLSSANFSTQVLHVPDPTTVWGPTQKSFYDLEREMRFQLATAIPGDVELMLQDEKQKFIEELEARLIAYRSMERAAHARKTSERLGEVEKRLRVLEKERSQIKPSVEGASAAELVEAAMAAEAKALEESVLQDESLLERIVQEREQLLRERENLKREVVELDSGKQTATDETWNRLQQALAALKELPEDASKVKRAKVEVEPEEASAADGSNGLVVVEEKLWKTEEEEKLEQVLEERKKMRLEAEEFERTGKRKPEPIDLDQFLSPREQLGQELADVFPRVDRHQTEEQKQKKARRRLEKRKASASKFRRPNNRFLNALFPGRRGKQWDVSDDLVPEEADLIWENSYGSLTREEFHEALASQVLLMNAKVLDASPQCVRLACHTEVIDSIEEFYQGDFNKVKVIGLGNPICVDERWEPRASDDAYVSTSIWSTGVVYATMYQHPFNSPNLAYRTDVTSLDPIPTNFVGNIFTILESTPERGFYVTDWSFDMAIPNLPEPVAPRHSGLSTEEIEERKMDETPERATMLPYGPPVRQERYKPKANKPL